MAIPNVLLLLISLIFFLFVLKKNVYYISVSRLNPITLPIYMNFILFGFIGMFFISIGLTDHYILNNIKQQNIFPLGIKAFSLMLIMFVIGMTISSFLLKFNSKEEVPRYIKKEIVTLFSRNDLGIYLTVCILTFISFVVIIYTFISIKTFPLFDVLFGTSEIGAQRLRIIVSREFSGITIIRNLLGITMTPLLSYIAFSYYKLTKDKKWKNLFLLLFLMSLIIITYDLSKAPILIYILGIMVIFTIHNGKIKFNRLVIYFIIIILLILSMYMIIFNTSFDDLTNINTGPVGRIVYGQISALFLTFEVFPYEIAFLKGESLPSFLGGNSLRSSEIIMSIYGQHGVKDGTAGVMNTVFIGEAYANFGWLGVIIGSIYVGILIQLLLIIFLRIRKTPLNIAFFTFFAIKIPLSGGFVDFFYNPLLLFLLILYCMIFVTGSLNNDKFIRGVRK